MSFKWDYATDVTRTVANGDDRVVPFTAKYNHGGELYPVYAPYDATASREGVVWLTDYIDEDNLKDETNGMTAMTPKGVASNALLKNSKNGQTVEGDVTFKGNVTLNKPISGTAGSLTNARNITVKSGSVEGGAASFDGSADITITLPQLDATTLRGIVPLSSIPQGAMERLIDVKTDEKRQTLTKNDVQNGDWVRVGDGETTYVVVDDNYLGTDEWERAFTQMSFGKSASADGFTEAKKIELTGDVTGSDTATGVNGWSIKATVKHVDASAIENGPIQIGQGGTGATTVKGAQDNLGITAIDGRVAVLEDANKIYDNGVTPGNNLHVVVNGVTDTYAGSTDVGSELNFHHNDRGQLDTASPASLFLNTTNTRTPSIMCSSGNVKGYLLMAGYDDQEQLWTITPPKGPNSKIAVYSGLYPSSDTAVLGTSGAPFKEANIERLNMQNGMVTASSIATVYSSGTVHSTPGFYAQNKMTSKKVSIEIDKDGNSRGVKVSHGDAEEWMLYADANDATHATVTDVTATSATVTDVTATSATVTDVTATGSLSIDGANNKTAVETFLSKLNIRMGASTDSIPSTGWNTTTGAPVDGCIFIKYE